MTRVWLIRHGEPVEEARGRCYGALDFGLSEAGRSQMARLAGWFRDKPVAAVYTSPLQRARESAQIVFGKAEVVQDLGEIHFGEFEGMRYDEIASQYPDVYRQWMDCPAAVRFPRGETLAEMRQRVLGAFERICAGHAGQTHIGQTHIGQTSAGQTNGDQTNDDQTIAIVSHAGVNRILLAWALQIPDAYIFRIAQDYGAASLLLAGDWPSVKMINVPLAGDPSELPA